MLYPIPLVSAIFHYKFIRYEIGYHFANFVVEISHGGGESRDEGGLDYDGDQVAKDVSDTIDSANDNLDARNAGKDDLTATVNNLATVGRCTGHH